MIVDFPHALANVLSTVEQGRLGYVLYRDPKSDRRVVVLVEGAHDAAAFEAILRSAGADDDRAAKSEAGRDFVLRAASPDGTSERDYFIEVKTSSGKRVSPTCCGWPLPMQAARRLANRSSATR